MAVFLFEFLFRGVDPNGANPGGASYHVILGQSGVDTWGAPTVQLSQAMTPAQAVAAGYTIPAIASAINTATMATNTQLAAQVVELQAQVVALGALPQVV